MDTRADVETSSVAAGLTAGTLVDDFRVERLLGRGGMGEVYLARDRTLGRRVALKLVRSMRRDDDRARARFLDEARATASFSHPHVVGVYAVGEWQGMPYLALEYVEGPNLLERAGEQPLGTMETIRVIRAVAEALSDAHERGICHRDLKPANVVIGRDGRPRVVDFGLAVMVTPDEQAESVTATMKGRGTPAYMAPERWRGETGGPAEDVWALGVMLFELLTGHRPYAQWGVDALSKAVRSDGPSPTLDGRWDGPERLRRLVAACLDKDPSARPSSRDVVAILAELQATRSGSAGLDDPFVGLTSFAERDADHFFGRDVEIAAFVERMRRVALLAVVGPSGAGKSSFVQAGVVPALRAQRPWIVLSLRPSDRPLANLAQRLVAPVTDIGSAEVTERDPHDLADALLEAPGLLALELRELAARHDCAVLLFVDQLEELVTLGVADRERAAFLAAISEAADDVMSPVRVVVAARDDFLGRLAVGSGFLDGSGQVAVLPAPTASTLEQVLRAPVSRTGYAWEDDTLPAEMVAEVSGGRASLPLLQFAARQLWDGRDSKRQLLLRRTFDSMGGVAGALARHADGVVDAMTSSDRECARRILLQLVTPERTRKPMRSRDLNEAVPEDRDGSVARRLVDERLLVTARGRGGGDEDDGSLELAHESLIVAWRTLVTWLDQSKESLVFAHEVDRTAKLWSHRGERAAELWEGDALAEALRQRRRLDATLSPLAARFLDASDERQRRRTRSRRGLLAAVAVVSATAAVIFALQARQLAQQKDAAEAARELADTRRHQAEQQRAEALREGARADLARGRVLAARAKVRTALEVEDAPEARALWWQLRREPLVWRWPNSALSYDVAFDPAGKWVAIASQDHGVYLADTTTRQIRMLRGHPDQVFALDVGPDGKRLVSGGWSGAVLLWDVERGEIVRRWTLPTGATAVAFSPDGAVVAAAGLDTPVMLWRAQDGSELGRLNGHGGRIAELAFDPSGEQLAAAADKGTWIWSWRNGELQHQSAEPSSDVAFSPDGKTFVSAHLEQPRRTLQLRRSADGTVRSELRFDEGVADVTFASGTELVVTDGQWGVWQVDLVSGRRAGPLAHGEEVREVAVEPAGRRMVVASHSQVRLWDRRLEVRARPDRGHRDAVRGVAFSDDGKTLLTGSWDRTVRMWEVASGREIARRHRNEKVEGVVFLPGQARFAVASFDLGVYETTGARLVANLPGHPREIAGLAATPDGGLATASLDGRVRLWNVRTGASRTLAADDADRLRGVAVSPDGRWVAAGSDDGIVRMWHADGGKLRRRLSGHGESVRGVRFSADGDSLLSASWDGTLRLWDSASGEETRRIGPLGARALFADVHAGVVGAPCSDGVARLIAADGSERQLRGHADEVNYLRFSHDGTQVATTSDDGTVRLWNVASGQPLWRGVGVLADPPSLVSHRGHERLDGTAIDPATLGDTMREMGREGALARRHGTRTCLLRRDGKVARFDGAVRGPVAEPLREAVVDLRATAAGCVTLDARGALSLQRADGSRSLSEEIVAIASHDDGLLTVDAREAVLWRSQGEDLARGEGRHVGTDVTAIATGGETRWWVGYDNGSVAEAGPEGPRMLALEGGPSAAVTMLVEGPAGTLLVGFSNGFVGLWDRARGTRLESAKLHGPVSHLEATSQGWVALTALGDHLVWDLAFFDREPCTLLRGVWEAIPVAWIDGSVAATAAPADHACAQP
jgi:WD40 repeat protein/tRNA A-37 threonylcarbamoyl transferase component Bud32